MFGKLLSASGLLLNIIGTLFVANDFFLRPGHDWKVDSFSSQIEWHKSIFEHFKTKLEKGPWNLSDQADEGEFLRNAMNKHKSFLDDLGKKLEFEKIRFSSSFYKYGYRGISLIAFGFFLQLVGLFIIQ